MFFSITTFSQNPDFFPFSNSQFLRTGTCRTYIHQFDLDYWAKHAISPYFGIVWVLFFLWKSALNPEIWAENCKNFNKIGDVLDPETDASHVRMC